MTNIRGSELGGSGSPDTVQGNKTPSDAYANPTDAQDVFALGALWNGATWDRAPGNTSGAFVQGNVADATADAGNGVKAAAVYKSAVGAALTNGQRGDLFVDNVHNLRVALYTPNSADNPIAAGNTFGNADARSATNFAYLMANYPLLFNGSAWDRQRTPATFKTATATAAGDTAVWTPAAGKKFRLMAYAIYVTANASQAVAGLTEIILRDATTATGVGYSVFVPGAAGTTFVDSSDSGWIQLGNGILSTTANNVLNVNLSAAFATGEVRVVACGTEE